MPAETYYAFFGSVIGSLLIGLIVTYVYAAIEDKKYPEQPVTVTTKVFMVLAFVLLGFLIFAIYYAYTLHDKLPKAVFTDKDFEQYKKSTKFLQEFEAKREKIPKVVVQQQCDSKDACYVGVPKPKTPKAPTFVPTFQTRQTNSWDASTGSGWETGWNNDWTGRKYEGG